MAPADMRENGEGPTPRGTGRAERLAAGIHPQAEIWNGRLAMLGLSLGIGVLLLVRLLSSSLTAAQ